MTQSQKPGAAMKPVAAAERIVELDVLRGVALIGIALINIEFFNRPLAESGRGLVSGLQGLDLLVAWTQHLLVRGKFWTLFSLLFGMGFAVMLERAQQLGREWLLPYLRRIAALAVFGLAHHVLLWGGDILLSYALAATGLIAILFAPWRGLLAAVATLVLLGLVPRLQPLHLIATSMAVLAVAAGVWRLAAPPGGGSRPRPPAPGVMQRPLSSRALCLGVALYVLPFVLLSSFAAGRTAATSAIPTGAVADHSSATQATAQRAPAGAASEPQRRTQAATDEAELIAQGSYREFAHYRLRHLVSSLPGDTLFMTTIVGVFLVGMWFVQSGLLRNARERLPVFRRLAAYGLAIGVGGSVLSAAIATARGNGLADDPFPVANIAMHLASLVTCLGYVGLIVLAMHGARSGAAMRTLAPLGRMALTNYLLQSVVFSWVFYGYGLGQAGIGVTAQAGFALALVGAQVVFSHWWLARFRYGPMEWLWRAITYWQWPAWRARRALATLSGG